MENHFLFLLNVVEVGGGVIYILSLSYRVPERENFVLYLVHIPDAVQHLP